MNKLQYEIFKFKGIVKDIQPVELMNGVPPSAGVPTPNVWTHGQNVHFDNESTHRVGGYAGFADPLPAGAMPIFGLNVLTPETSYWIWIDGQAPAAPKVYVTDGVAHFDISPPSSADLVTNGDFEAGATGWTDTSPAGEGNITFNGGICNFYDTAGSTPKVGTGITQDIAGLIPGALYQITYVIPNAFNGSIYASLGGTAGIPRSEVGTYSETILAGSADTLLAVLYAEEVTDILIDDLTLIVGSTLTGGKPGEWSGTVLNNVPVLNNQIDAPFWWDGDTASPVTTIPGWPVDQRCKAIRAYKYHLLALNLTRASVSLPEMYAWSNSTDPGTIPQEWDSTPSNDAGDNILATSPGGILDGLVLRDDFIIYKSHSTFILSYIAGQFVFTVRKLFNTSGIQALNCVQELRGHHWVFTDDDMIRHDGNTFQSIADKQVRQFVLNGINPDTQILAHVAAHTPTDEIWFCLPTVDNTRLAIALVYSFTDSAWGVRNLPDVTFVGSGILPTDGISPSWDSSTTEWENDTRYWAQANYSITNDNLLLFAPDNNKMYNVDASHQNDGAPVEAFVERTMWTVGGESQLWDNVLVRSVYPVITGSPGDIITIRTAGTTEANKPIQWSPDRDYVIGDPIKVDLFSHGRYFNIRFSSSGGQPWEIHRIGIEYTNEAKF